MALTKISNEVIEQNLENYLKKGLKASSALSDLEITTYADAAGINPVDGIGDSAGIIVSLNTSSPLSGDADLRIAKDASNRQGNGISIPFTIDNRHLAKVLQISFDAELFSGTYASGDLRISIIQDPAGSPVVLEPVNTGITLGIANQRIRHIASFQTHVSITSYRLCIHVSSTSASAYTVDFANFKVWEPNQSIGSIITDWQSYTPNIQGITSSSSSFQWRRVGGSVEIFGSLTFSSAISAIFQLPLPSGLSINSSVTRKTLFGNFQLGKTTADANNPQWYLIGIGDTSYLTLSPQSVNYNSRLTDFNSISTGAVSGDIMTLQASVPIQGWGSSVSMSSDSGDGRVVIANYDNPANVTANNTTPVRFTTLVNDTHNAYDTATGKFTAPISGYYNISLSYTHGVTNNSQVYINNIATAYIILNASSTSGQGSTVVYLNAGQTVDVRPDQTGTVATAQTTRRFSIFRISAGSQVIASQETVAASYYSAATQTSLTTQINFGTRVYDTHGAVTTGVGAWKFTAPMVGKYLITGTLICNSTTALGVRLYKNNVLTIFNASAVSTSSNQAVSLGAISTTIDLFAGDFIDLRPEGSVNWLGGSINSATVCQIQITRVGN